MNSSILCFVSLVFLSSALAAVFQHEIHRRDSLKTKLIKEGRWNEYYALKQSQLHGKFSNFKSTSQNIEGYLDAEYYVNITIGTPDQLFSVVLDTGGVFSIPDITCDACQHVRKFNASKSSTYHKTHYCIANSTEWGVYGQDFVRLGNLGTNQLVIPKAMFGQQTTPSYHEVADGILGLGFPAQNIDGVDPPIITAIKSGILDNPVVTIFFKNTRESSPTNNGAITYGALDTVHCDRNVVYEHLSDPNSFTISLKKATLGSSKFSGNWTTDIESSANFLFAPQSIVDAFVKEVNATYNTKFGAYTVDCKAKFNLHLTVGSKAFTLTEKEIVTNDANTCIFKLLGLQQDMWIFGHPWFRTVCNVLDYHKKRIGFAKIIHS